MYCANYDYLGIYEPFIVDKDRTIPQYECAICLELKKTIIDDDTLIIDMPIKLQNSLYIMTCDCNIWIHVSCLDMWYNLKHNCPICKNLICKNNVYAQIIKPIISCYLYIAFGAIYSIICILKLIRLFIIILFWYNVMYMVWVIVRLLFI